MLILCQDMDTDIVIYDYEGFGCSDGIAKCDSLTRDLSAVYDYTRQFFHGRDIFLVGESSILHSHFVIVVGSVPTCAFASSSFKTYENNQMTGIYQEVPLGGIVLQSALYSGSVSFSSRI